VHPACFIRFNASVGNLSLPGRFTYPFYYEPHPLAAIAADELQQLLPPKTALSKGRMYGVLVVRNADNELGYLCAYAGDPSGKFPETAFVPPVFNLQREGKFYPEGQAALEQLDRRIKTLETAESFISAKQLTEAETALFLRKTAALKEQINTQKAARKIRRAEAQAILAPEAYAALIETLGQESLQEQYALNDLGRSWKQRQAEILPPYEQQLNEIRQLQNERKERAAALQQQFIETVAFSDKNGHHKSLLELFGTEPPSGAGTCTAPKLLEYAFRNSLEPMAFAQFWWGNPPGHDIRKHGVFYPACRGKCEPVLRHMLAGIETDENPVHILLAKEKTIETLFEDDYLAVIHKPAELLSIPGGTIDDSVETRMRKRYPNATGMLIVHRLDMSTSGLMVIAKTKNAHEHLQRQFLQRTVKKRYIALLDGTVDGEEGIIELPLIVDLNDRPRQLVSFQYGKPARTRWKVIERRAGQTLVHFFPETGRTHQLRVHAAHPLGLNAPIHGDELYGMKADRLYLHAEELAFVHPVTKAVLCFKAAASESFNRSV
jgi:tRNA pseudouridine32 synthase/23S rRNA pseudouridine746 synthase